jgi:hypothetical protein
VKEKGLLPQPILRLKPALVHIQFKAVSVTVRDIPDRNVISRQLIPDPMLPFFSRKAHDRTDI